MLLGDFFMAIIVVSQMTIPIRDEKIASPAMSATFPYQFVLGIVYVVGGWEEKLVCSD